MLAWFDPFAIGRYRYEEPAPPEEPITLVTPPRGDGVVRGVTLASDGRGQRFVFGSIAEAPTRYGTSDQLMRSSFAGEGGGPQSLTEAMGSEASAFIGNVGSVVRVIALAVPGYDRWNSQDEERVVTGGQEGSMIKPEPLADRVILSNGCLRLGAADGPLVILTPRVNAIFIDDAGWLTVGGLAGMHSLRVGETGVVRGDPVQHNDPALEALRLQCGGGAGVFVTDIQRPPVCDITAAQAEENRSVMTENQRQIEMTMRAGREEQIANCMAMGESRIRCQNTIPPMPPAPGMSMEVPHPGLGPGNMCIPQEDLPLGAWTPPAS
ncbi:hypothetical protein AB433_16210 [Croceicoccus naphthovorans]|uniref:Uncharacterized protein n=1 Tax=Croceicoccus naphthovorans TaxID=1348774 RepID=A0A0G3XKR1_9SPHN|nr:hypothetical protein AB433_16210 [Croceicoccus naphthovorans]